MPRITIICAAALISGLFSTATFASVIVVKSRGPSSKAYPPGKTLGSPATLRLQGGDIVTVLGPGSARTYRGPGNFDATQISLESASNQRGRFGAMRRGTVARSPSIWDIDVSQDGRVCVPKSRKIQLWRPNSDRVENVQISAAKGSAKKLTWASGKAVTALPAGVAVSTGGRFEISWEGRPDRNKLELVTIESIPTDSVALAKLLIGEGCQNQLDRLVADASRDAD